MQVVTALQSDVKFLPELFLRLEKHTPDDAEWNDLVAFLQVGPSYARASPTVFVLATPPGPMLATPTVSVLATPTGLLHCAGPCCT